MNSFSIKAMGGLYPGGEAFYTVVLFFTGRWAYNITGGGASKWVEVHGMSSTNLMSLLHVQKILSAKMMSLEHV